MTTATTLHTLMVDELRDLYHAERQLVKALPKLAKAATADELREAIEHHLGETEEHVTRLEKVFELLDEQAKPKTCAGMAGIIEEGADLIKESEKGAALDAGIIGGGQRAEHYEMAAYGTVLAWAKAMGHEDVAKLLQATLDEEKAADQKLSSLAEGGINEAAMNGEASEVDQASGETRQSPQGKRQAKMSATANGRARNGARKRAAAR
jgi:ferritin-like metal-binding protein YciE